MYQIKAAAFVLKRGFPEELLPHAHVHARRGTDTSSSNGQQRHENAKDGN